MTVPPNIQMPVVRYEGRTAKTKVKLFGQEPYRRIPPAVPPVFRVVVKPVDTRPLTRAGWFGLSPELMTNPAAPGWFSGGVVKPRQYIVPVTASSWWGPKRLDVPIVGLDEESDGLSYLW